MILTPSQPAGVISAASLGVPDDGTVSWKTLLSRDEPDLFLAAKTAESLNRAGFFKEVFEITKRIVRDTVRKHLSHCANSGGVQPVEFFFLKRFSENIEQVATGYHKLKVQQLVMFRLFCCRSRNPTRVEVDEVTDSLEKCLSVERGVVEFKLFLERNHFKEESATLAFALKCQSVLTEISRLSPFTRAGGLPARIQNEITNLYDMADDINFDLDQMNALRNLHSTDTETKVHILQSAQGWALDLLQDIYKAFRKQALRGV